MASDVIAARSHRRLFTRSRPEFHARLSRYRRNVTFAAFSSHGPEESHMDLPFFRYHPDPIASGSIVASDAQCICCNARRGHIYTGPAYCEREIEDSLCPWCIADGSAHRSLDVSFTDPAGFPDGIQPAVVEEIAYRTPGFNTWQQEKWLTCCGDAAAFLETVGYKEICARYPRLEGALMMYIVHQLEISGAAATRFLRGLNRDHGPTAYIFACRHCDAQPAYIDYL
jgi:uncharacterized protein CbrC (UPF0167 family)